MIVKNSRAQRRHDRARLKKKRQFHWGYGHITEWIGRTPDKAGEINYMSPKIAGGVVNTPTPCSCYMCGNPRRHGWAEKPLTLNEQRADASFADGVTEYNNWTDNWVENYWIEYFYDYGACCVDNPADDWYLRWLYIKE